MESFCTCFLLLVAPLTFFFPGRATFRTLGIFCCILIVFFCHARGSNLYHSPLPLVAVFPCPMRYTLTKPVLTLPPKGYLYPLRATPWIPWNDRYV